MISEFLLVCRLIVAAYSVCRWSKGEQSTALATATDSTLQVFIFTLNLEFVILMRNIKMCDL